MIHSDDLTADGNDCCKHCFGPMLTLRDIGRMFKLGETATRDLVNDPAFPRRIVVSARCHRWVATEVALFREMLRDA